MANIEIGLDQIGVSIGVADTGVANSALADAQASKATLPNSAMGKRVGITTLGCKVNSYESELIGEALKTDDWQLVANTAEADLYLINTCTVTQEADRQARQEVRKAIKRNPEALVVVTGCYAQMDPQACADILSLIHI